MLRKFVGDPSHILGSEPLELCEDLSYEEAPVRILERKEQVLRTKVIPYVKVLWRNHKVEEATWEGEESMKQKYPHLFSSGTFDFGTKSFKGGESCHTCSGYLVL